MSEPPVNDAQRQMRERETKFFENLGIAVTEWAYIDEELFNICFEVLRTPSQQHAAIVYYRTPTLDARLTLVDELVSTVLPKPDRKTGAKTHPSAKEWFQIVSDIRAGFKIRRQLAHSPTYMVTKTDPPLPSNFPSHPPDGKPVFYQVVDVWYASAISAAERLRGKETETPELKVEDIAAHIATLKSILRRLIKFHAHELLKLLR